MMTISNRSILVGDIGSTKSDWAFIDYKGARSSCRLKGFNPVAHNQEAILEIVDALSSVFAPPDDVYYYGAGINSDTMRSIIKEAFAQVFTGVRCHVESDLLGAARALCADRSGIICILGTGSNCATYENAQLRVPIPSLGYPLGDEGGGWRIGAELLRRYFYQDMPAILREEFKAQFEPDAVNIVNILRRSESPNTYLASFARFAVSRHDDPWILELVRQELDTFVRVMLAPLRPHRQVDAIGSIAMHFRDTLAEVMASHQIVLGKTVQSPISALVDYHVSRR